MLKVPEAATLYFERGGRFPFATPPDVSEFFGAGDRNLLWESWLVELKLSLENHAQSAAARSGAVALLCDRGIFDSRAYLASDDEWRRLLRLGGWGEAELLSRYCGVACLDVAPSSYYNLGNEARHESYAEALFRGDATWDAWCNAVVRVDSRARPAQQLVVPAPPPPSPVPLRVPVRVRTPRRRCAPPCAFPTWGPTGPTSRPRWTCCGITSRSASRASRARLRPLPRPSPPLHHYRVHLLLHAAAASTKPTAATTAKQP